MKKSDRRLFLKKLSLGSFSVPMLPGVLLPQSVAGKDHQEASQVGYNKKITIREKERAYNAPYSGDYLARVAFPVGGIGAGMFCLEGTGSISHMSIANKPDILNEPNMFAAISVKGLEKGAKVLEGPVPEWKIVEHDCKRSQYSESLNGGGGTNYGLPRFEDAEFRARFPFGSIDLKDNDLPLDVQITGWSPFIPTDEDNSSLPVGALEYKFTNRGNEALEAVFSYNSMNFTQNEEHRGKIKSISNGFILAREGTEERPHLQTDFAIFTDNDSTIVDHCWFRGGWFDPLTMVWETIKGGKMKRNDPVEEGAPGASLFVPFKLQAGEEKTIRVMMSWYVPESDLKIGEVGSDEGCSSPASLGLVKDGVEYSSTTYKPWYSSMFKDIDEISRYWRDNYEDLYKRSGLFKEAFYSSTLPPEVMEAVAANLTILKSPTVMRQYDGRMWNWEGSSYDKGCCHGSCTHVWNYAQAIPHLFPALERSLRHAEFCEDQNKEGHQVFRSNLPISPNKHDFYAAADGQLGGIMKVHREWRISGDNDWLKKMFPMVKASMDYCIRTWDPKNKGVLEEPHHNTYDIEFWGPDGMCTSIYLGALSAISRMGEFLEKDVTLYKELYSRGKRFMEDELYEGEYFIQKIQWTGLEAPDPVKASEKSMGGEYSEEALAILQEEGPKYQYGKGCLSDGILGGWIARMCGLEDPVDSEKTRSHLRAVHKYNLRKDLTDHVNPQRPTYALGREGGLLLCSWPKGGKLSLPFVYSNEVWTGIEYQVASHLMLMGQVDEGLEITRVCRNRYDGRIRNPFNEYECGSWYGRAQASYGLIEGLTGVRYDAVDRTLHIDSRIGNFTSFISTETGFGTVRLKDGKPSMKIVHGTLEVDNVLVSGKKAKLL